MTEIKFSFNIKDRITVIYIWTSFSTILTKHVELHQKFIAHDSLASYLSEIIYRRTGRWEKFMLISGFMIEPGNRYLVQF